MNSTSTSSSSAGPPSGKTTNPFRRNDNGKRPRPAPTEVFASLQAMMGSAPTTRDLSLSTGGTSCYGVVVKEPVYNSYPTKKEGGRFDVARVTVLMGLPDPGKGVTVDERTREVIFTIPDPYEWEQAVRAKQESGSKAFIEVDKHVEHRLGLDRPVRLSVPNMTDLPGVRMGAIVRIDGLNCKSYRGTQGAREFQFGYEAKDIGPLPAVGADPARMVRFLKEAGVLSRWHREEPLTTEEELKQTHAYGGRAITVVPIVRKDDEPERVMAAFPGTTAERGFVAMVRPSPDAPERFFQVPSYDRKVAEAAAEKDKSVKVPKETEAGLDNYRSFSIKASWDVVVTQWDTARHPAMGMSPDRALTYETTVTAWSRALWTTGVSHPQLWATMRFHVQLLDGVLAFQEDRGKTSEVQANLNRHMRMQNAAQADPADPAALGVGIKQLPRVWCRGVALDVRGYLRRAALRCSFPTATILMGAQEGDADNERRAIRLMGRVGEEKILDPKTRAPTGGTIKLDFRPEGFVCLNATTQYTNMRLLDRELDQYYVLTPIAPRFEMDPSASQVEGPQMMSMRNARRCEELVHRIKDAEVLAICQRATRGPGDFAALRDEFMAAEMSDPAADSKRAAGEWLSYSYLGDYAQNPAALAEEDTPWLVFGTFRDDAAQNARMQEEQEKALAMAIEGWAQGPSRVFAGGRATVRLNAPDTEADRLVKGEAPNPAVPSTSTPAASAEGGEGQEPAAKRARTEEGGEEQQSWQDIPSPPPPLEDPSQEAGAPPLPPRDDGEDVEMGEGNEEGGEEEEEDEEEDSDDEEAV